MRDRRWLLVVCRFWLLPGLLLGATGPSVDFTQSIRPVLAENCGMCHNPSKPRNPANFLKAQTAKDIEADRGLWHNVAAQLRNRTMPPMASKLSEDDRLRVATWIDNQLRQTACSGGDYAGASAFRRLNRREYHNTIRDLLGVDFERLPSLIILSIGLASHLPARH
jgi:cytochrome c553